jgi:uncharacterized integral membrane protein
LQYNGAGAQHPEARVKRPTALTKEKLMIRYLIFIPLLILALLLVLFGVQNTQVVTVRFLNYSVENLSVSLVIVIAAICGALLVALLNVWSGIQRTLRGRRTARERSDLEARHRELQKRVAELERENQALKGAAPAPPEPAKAKATSK